MSDNGDLYRPTDWSALIGQTQLKERLRTHIAGAIEYMEPLKPVLLAGPPGSGKGQPLDALIRTPGGWVEMGSLKVGDVVSADDGDYCFVKGIYDRGVLPTYIVEFEDGAKIKCDGDHLWSVQTRKMNSWKTISTIELFEQDLVEASSATGNRKGQPKYRIPIVGPIQTGGVNGVDLPFEPYLMGVLLANGGIGGGRPVVTTNDSEIIREIESRNIEGLDIQDKSIEGYARRYYIKGIAERIRNLGLQVKSASKFIPEMYFNADIWDRWSLLSGLMDCDGSAMLGNRRPRYFTTSKMLADNVVELVNSLGGIAKVEIDDREGQNPCYEVAIQIETCPFTLERKAQNFTPKTPRRGIVSVVESEPCEIRCIEVDSLNNLYVTEGHVVTHNTTVAGLIADEMCYDYFTYITPPKPSTLRTIVQEHVGAVVLFDEIHRWPQKAQEDLLPLLEDGYIQTADGQKIYSDDLTIIGATTEPDKIVAPLYDRFTIKPPFEEYSDQEMAAIVMIMGYKTGLEIEKADALILGRATGGVPRNAKTMVLMARDAKTVNAEEILHHLRLTPDGLTQDHVNYLKILKSSGGQCGLQIISAHIQIPNSAIINLERLLLKRNLIKYESSGRSLTSQGFATAKALK